MLEQIIARMEQVPEHTKMKIGGMQFAVGGVKVRVGDYLGSFDEVIRVLEK